LPCEPPDELIDRLRSALVPGGHDT